MTRTARVLQAIIEVGSVASAVTLFAATMWLLLAAPGFAPPDRLTSAAVREVLR